MHNSVPLAFAVIDLDSAALAGTATIAHPMTETGEWQLSAYRDEDRALFDVTIRVRDDASAMMAAVDLGTMQRDGVANAVDEAAAEYALRTSGYLRLRSTSREPGGLFALLRKGGRGKAVWDSRTLGPGDVFACMPLRPGRFALADRLARSQCVIAVPYPDPRKNTGTPRKMLDAVRLRAGDLAGRDIKLRPGQGLVVEAGKESRFVLKLEEADDGPHDLADWRAKQRSEFVERRASKG